MGVPYLVTFSRHILDLLGGFVHAKELVMDMAQESSKGFWRRRSTLSLKLWVWFHVAIFFSLEFAGLFPGLSHMIDLLTLVVLDEIVQLLLVTPALKELWRREFQKGLEEQED